MHVPLLHEPKQMPWDHRLVIETRVIGTLKQSGNITRVERERDARAHNPHIRGKLNRA